MRMNFYKCKVRLAGTTTSEVPKRNVSAAEIMLLRAMHGLDSVLAIEKTHSGETNSHEERSRLANIYKARADIVNKTFGPFGELPGELDPETEKKAAEAIEAKEAAEAAKKAEIDAKVEEEVQKRLAALEAGKKAAEREKAVNKPDNPKAKPGEERGTLTLGAPASTS